MEKGKSQGKNNICVLVCSPKDDLKQQFSSGVTICPLEKSLFCTIKCLGKIEGKVSYAGSLQFMISNLLRGNPFSTGKGFLPDMGNLERLFLSYNIHTFYTAEQSIFEEFFFFFSESVFQQGRLFLW